MSAEPTILVEASAGWALATRGRLVLSVWRDQVTLERIDAVDRAIVALLPHCGGLGYGSITVIEPSLENRMNAEARAASTELQRRHSGQMKCSAYLVEGTSFLRATVRTVLSNMRRITRSPFPIRAFATLPEVVTWVAPSVGLEPHHVTEAVDDARRAGLGLHTTP